MMLHEFYEGKRVTIVGAGPHKIFRACDTLVSINNHSKLLGQAPDVVYLGACMDVGLPDKRAKYYVVAMGGHTQKCIEDYAMEHGIMIEYFVKGIFGGENPWGPGYEWLPEICKAWDMNPFTGIVAAIDALRLGADEVFLTGMDFYMDENGELPMKMASHWIGPQREFLKHYLEVDPRLIVDNRLAQALDAPIREICAKTEHEKLVARLNRISHN